MRAAQLHCQQLTKTFGGVRALHDLSLTLPASGVVAIVGPNGAGKSTLVDAITGIVRPDAGRIYFGRKNITHWPIERVSRLGIVRTFQQLRTILDLSVLENIKLAYRGQIGERFAVSLVKSLWRHQEGRLSTSAMDILALVGLDRDNAHLLARELSFGQQKLLSLACCLALGGRIFLLDEPLAGVHPEIRSTIQVLIKDIAARGGLVVFVEHDLDAVRAVADEVIVMDQGTILAMGKPSQVLGQPNVSEAYVH